MYFSSAVRDREQINSLYNLFLLHALFKPLVIQGLSLRVMEFLTVFIGQQILYSLENVVINSQYAVSTSADLNTLSQHSSARLFDNVFFVNNTGCFYSRLHIVCYIPRGVPAPRVTRR